MQVIEKHIDDLKPYKNNPRKHTERQINQIAESIKEFGFVNPILVDETDTILAGHGRYHAAKQINQEMLPVVVVDKLNDQQKKALVIADNKIAMNSSWDEDMLWNQIRQLNDEGFDLSVLAFDEMEILPMIDSNVVTDPLAEWQDMPEFDQEDLTPHRTLFVHFRNDQDYDTFLKLVEQTGTDKTKSIWFPELEMMQTEKKRYG